MNTSPNSVNFVDWLTQMAWAVEHDSNVRKTLIAAGPLRVQFDLPVKFFLVGSGTEWNVGLGQLFSPRSTLKSTFEGFAKLLQGSVDSSQLSIEGNPQEVLTVFKALSLAQTVVPTENK